jgi:hypothetical protein
MLRPCNTCTQCMASWSDVRKAHCRELGARNWRKQHAALVANTELVAVCCLQAFQLTELRPLSRSKGMDPGTIVVMKAGQLKLLVAQPMACHCMGSVMISVRPLSKLPLSNVSRWSNGSRRLLGWPIRSECSLLPDMRCNTRQ